LFSEADQKYCFYIGKNEEGDGVVAIINVCALERKMSSYWLRVIEGRARSCRDGILQLTVLRAKLKRLD
jgi:hypothetical protein